MVWNGFSSIFSSKNGSEWNSEFFFLPKMVRNGIPKFSLLKMVRTGIPRSIKNGLEWNGFSLPRNGSERNSEVLLFRKGRNSDGTPACSALFRIPRNNFFVGKWQPYSQIQLNCCLDADTGFMLCRDGVSLKSKKKRSSHVVHQYGSFEPIFITPEVSPDGPFNV